MREDMTAKTAGQIKKEARKIEMELRKRERDQEKKKLRAEKTLKRQEKIIRKNEAECQKTVSVNQAFDFGLTGKSNDDPDKWMDEINMLDELTGDDDW